MSGRFPSDLLIVVFGPIFVAVIALSTSALIYHAAQAGRNWMLVATLTVSIAALLFLFVCFRHRRRSFKVSRRNARDESTPNI